MRLPSVPGPSDLLSAVHEVRDGFSDALALIPRVGVAVGASSNCSPVRP